MGRGAGRGGCVGGVGAAGGDARVVGAGQQQVLDELVRRAVRGEVNEVDGYGLSEWWRAALQEVVNLLAGPYQDASDARVAAGATVLGLS